VKKKEETVRPRRRISGRQAWSIAGILLGLFLVKESWEWWNSPYHILQRGVARGQRTFLLTELIGAGWEKACLVPEEEYMWDDVGYEVKDFFNQQFEGTQPSDLSHDGLVGLYVEHGKSRKWYFMGERRDRYSRPEKQVAKPPYWDRLMGKKDVFIECAIRPDTTIIVLPDNTVVTKGFDRLFRFGRDDQGKLRLVDSEVVN
jgi:hypothetical protein